MSSITPLSTVPSQKQVGRTRRLHQKSRRGCAACKKRRIKCDEEKPSCDNCTRSSISCSFLELLPSKPVYEGTGASPKKSSNYNDYHFRTLLFPRSQIQHVYPFSRHSKANQHVSDLNRDPKLLHHFVTKTCPTLSDSNMGRQVWAFEIPRLACSHPYLTDGLLAISLVHIAWLKEENRIEDKSCDLALAMKHINRALPTHRQELEHIGSDNIGPALAFASMVAIFIYSIYRNECNSMLISYSKKAQERPSLKLLELAVCFIRASRGIIGILHHGRELIKVVPITPSCAHRPWPECSLPQSRYSSADDEKLALVEKLWRDETGIDENESATLTDTLHRLRRSFAQVERINQRPLWKKKPPLDSNDGSERIYGTPSDFTITFTWFITISNHYIRLLEQGNSCALVILAHYAVLLNRVRDKRWWFQDLPKYFVTMASLFVDKDARQWIEWPLSEVGKC